jgi:hypothetical protein
MNSHRRRFACGTVDTVNPAEASRPQSPTGTKSALQPSVADRAHEGHRTMKKTIFAALAVLGISLATGALAPAANAYTYLFAPNESGGTNS